MTAAEEIFRTLGVGSERLPEILQSLAELPSAAEAVSGLADPILLQTNALAEPCSEGPFSGLARKLAWHGPCVSGDDVDKLRQTGNADQVVLEVIATVALGKMLAGLAGALKCGLDCPSNPAESEAPSGTAPQWNSGSGPYLHRDSPLSSDQIALLRAQYGFVPKFLSCQPLWPVLLEAEIRALDQIIFCEDHLTRIQKECILLAVSARNFSNYGVALHDQVLNVLGLSQEDRDAILGNDFDASALPDADKGLLTQAPRLAGKPSAGHPAFDSNALSEKGFTRAQVLEAIMTASLGNFFNTLQFGLGVPPDFPLRRVFTEKDLYPEGGGIRPTSDAEVELDPDADLLARVKSGETDVFEELVRRHSRRIFGTLHGILGNYEEARDAAQEVFIKAFEHIGRFEGRSKFSTWVTSIAVNTGTEMLRRQKPNVPLEDSVGDDFRPRLVQGWARDPEAIFSASQVSTLVREAVLRLPQKYRVALLLRDINQLSTEDAAEALGLSVPALKARVLRGRLMLRESLAPHFTDSGRSDA